MSKTAEMVAGTVAPEQLRAELKKAKAAADRAIAKAEAASDLYWDAVGNMGRDDLRAHAKASGVPNTHNHNMEDLLDRLADDL